MNQNPLLARLRNHVTGAIERGECEAIVEKPAPHYVIFPNGLRFAPSPKLLVNSLFNPKGTDAGYYKVKRNGVLFFIGNEPRLFLVDNPGNYRFFVTCSRDESGRIRYMFSTSTVDEKAFGLPERYREKSELADSIISDVKHFNP